MDIKEGDVVLVQEDHVKRNKWKLGRIEEIIRGEDGIVRGAVVRTSNNGNVRRIRRPLQKLYPLELRSHPIEGRVCKDTNEVGKMDADDGDERAETVEEGRKQTDQQGEMKGCNENECSAPFGPQGDAIGGGSGQTFNDNLDRLISNSIPLKSKRNAAIDGQFRRRIMDLGTE